VDVGFIAHPSGLIEGEIGGVKGPLRLAAGGEYFFFFFFLPSFLLSGMSDNGVHGGPGMVVLKEGR